MGRVGKCALPKVYDILSDILPFGDGCQESSSLFRRENVFVVVGCMIAGPMALFAMAYHQNVILVRASHMQHVHR